MTVSIAELAIYALALVVLVMTPGPVVVAVTARTLASGWRSAVPLSAGVAICDMIWPLLAVFGLAAIVQVNADIMMVLRYAGAAILIWMGWRLLSGRERALDAKPDPALMQRTAWRGFAAGLLVSIGNPKAILFFVGLLPNLFDVAAFTAIDAGIIVVMSAVVPFMGNCVWMLAAHTARELLRSDGAVRRVNQVSGGALAGAGAWIAAA
ncbi:MAG: LysE family translocator [Pseudomonadota bacterium]